MSSFASGQSYMDSLYQAGICDDNGFCIPQIPGLPRSKAVVFRYNRTWSQSIKSEISDSAISGNIDRSTLIDFKLRFPILLKENLKVILGAQYKSEEFQFDKPSLAGTSFYNTLHERPFKTFGASVYAVKPFKGNRYALGRLKLKLSGDFSREEIDDYFRSSLSILYGKRAKTNMSWGVGLTYSYSFGKQFVYPVVAYSKVISEVWSIEALLPASIRLRYKIDERNILEFTNRLIGDSYNIAFDNIDGNNLFLEKADFLTALIYEREIHDFFWFSASFGHRLNLKFDLSDESIFPSTTTPLISNTLANTMFYELSLFLVPPKKWKRK